MIFPFYFIDTEIFPFLAEKGLVINRPSDGTHWQNSVVRPIKNTNDKNSLVSIKSLLFPQMLTTSMATASSLRIGLWTAQMSCLLFSTKENILYSKI